MRETMTSEESWRKVEQALGGTFKQNRARIVWLQDVRNELRELAAPGISTAPDFTLHNETHSDNVVLLLERLVKLSDEFELSEHEAYLLVAAAYLHDVGMFCSAARVQEDILPDLAASLRFCEGDFCDGGARYQSELAGKPVGWQIRAVHHLLSAYMIREEGGSIFSLPARDVPHVIAICRGHRKANLCERRCGCYETKQTRHGPVRRGLLAALLRLADALDIYPERAPERTFQNRAWDFFKAPVALKHWLNHYFATSVYLAIGDREGNHYLDCQLSYTVPIRKELNGRPYKDFIAPLFNDMEQEMRRADFDVQQYPPALLQAFDIADIQVNLHVSAEPGAVKLHDRLVQEIQASGCEDIVEFLDHLQPQQSRLRESSIERLVMNRRSEVGVFQMMLQGDDPQHRLMFIVGDSGQGKTWLMRIFERMAAEHQVLCLRFDLGTPLKFDDILDGIWRRLGAHLFPTYSARRRKAKSEQQTASARQQELAECFFADWQAIGNSPRLALLFDTFEMAAPALRHWIEDVFLEGLKHIEQVITVIGGQRWPKVKDESVLATSPTGGDDASEQEYLSELRQKLVEHCDKDELRVLCFDLGVEYEDLPDKKSSLAMELIIHLHRRGRISELVQVICQRRPDISWGDIPADNGQALPEPVVSSEQLPGSYWLIHGHTFFLKGVQVRDYESYAKQRGLDISDAELKQLHRSFEGRPKLFVDHIQAQVQMGV